MVSTRKRRSAALSMRRGSGCSTCRGTCCARDAAACSRAGAALKTLNHAHYYCSLCAADYEPTLDKLVEVTFTVNPGVRRIAAHDPDSLPFAEYMRQIFWSSSNDIPDDVESAIQKVTLDAMELGAGEKAAMSLNSPERVCDRLRPRHPLVALSRGRRRGDAGAAQSVARLRRRPCAQRHAQDPAGSGAHLVRKQDRPPDDAGDLAP